MTPSLGEIYKKTLGFNSLSIKGSQHSIDFLSYQGKLSSYPRMLEYFVYELQMKFEEDNILSERTRDFLMSSNENIRLYCFSDSSLFNLFPENFINNNSRILRLEFVTNVLQVDFSISSSFDAYLSTLKRKRRYKANKVLKDPSISISVSNDILDYDDFVNMHKTQWGTKGDPSILNDTRWYNFYKMALEEEIFILHKLEYENEVVAYHLGFVLDGTFHYLMPTFTHCSKLDSPGFSLLIKLMETYYNDPKIKRFSLGSGDYSYKRWLANTSRVLFRLNIKSSRYGFFIITTKLKLKQMVSKIIKVTGNRK